MKQESSPLGILDIYSTLGRETPKDDASRSFMSHGRYVLHHRFHLCLRIDKRARSWTDHDLHNDEF